MTKLILERTRLQQNVIYIDERIQFQEIDEYFFSGCACAYFQIAVDTYTNLNPECISTVRNILRDAVNMFANAGNIF